jgi:hypothetical protein
MRRQPKVEPDLTDKRRLESQVYAESEGWQVLRQSHEEGEEGRGQEEQHRRTGILQDDQWP